MDSDELSGAIRMSRGAQSARVEGDVRLLGILGRVGAAFVLALSVGLEGGVRGLRASDGAGGGLSKAGGIGRWCC